MGGGSIGTTTVYRARIGDFTKNIENDNDMRAPKDGISNDGRGNPKGVSYFYTSCKVKTAISEVRPYKGSNVTVAEFNSDKSFELIDFRSIETFERYEPFRYPLKPVTRCFLQILIKNLEKPILNKESMEYIPLQYIIAFIKAQKKQNNDGLIYNSSVDKGGVNYLFYSDKDFKLINKKLYHISELEYKFQEK